MYYKTAGENTLIIKRGQQYIDLLSGQRIYFRDISYDSIKNEEFNNLLEILQEQGLDYFIKGFNETTIVTKNMGLAIRNLGGYKVSSSMIGRTKRVPFKLFQYVYSMTYRIGQYTIRDANIFIMFIKECLQGGWILKQENLPKRKYYESKGGLNPKFLKERNLFIEFSQEILRLMDSFEDKDQDKLTDILNRYKVDEILELYSLANSDVETFNEKISCIYNNNQYKLLAIFKT